MNRGFTLIELSIVLVIIGLVVGGVLVGRDLIEAAKVRSEVSQYDAFSTAASTFKSKYSCLPGDCPHASQFFSSTPTVTLQNGNGDGSINRPIVPGNFTVFQNSETAQFFAQLYLAGLIAYLPIHVPLTDLIPPSKIQGRIAIYSNSVTGTGYNARTVTADGKPYYLTAVMPNPANSMALDATSASRSFWTASQAKAVDVKLDDGNPLTGTVRVTCSDWSSGNPIYDVYVGQGCREVLSPQRCVNAGAYNLTQNPQDCGLRVLAAF